jgi:hypothetical protein
MELPGSSSSPRAKILCGRSRDPLYLILRQAQGAVDQVQWRRSAVSRAVSRPGGYEGRELGLVGMVSHTKGAEFLERVFPMQVCQVQVSDGVPDVRIVSVVAEVIQDGL